jgi:hypothetical protein
MIRAFAALVMAAMLVCLFLIPAAKLDRIARPMEQLAYACIDAALNENWPDAVKCAQGMCELVDGHELLFKTMFDHDEIVALETATHSAYRLACVEDQAQLLMVLEEIIADTKNIYEQVTLELTVLF